MDIESFSQCLTFMQATSNNNASAVKYLPVIATLAGTGLGFVLNQYVTWKKDGRAKKDKKNCCEEDIHEISNVCKQMIPELLGFCRDLNNRVRPVAHNFPPAIKVPLLEEYYPEIAHTFSVNQRYWLKLALRLIDEINLNLEKFFDSQNERSMYRVSVVVVNLIASVVDLYKRCYQILLDKECEFVDDEESFLGFGVEPVCIYSFKALKDNAEKNNSILKLPNS